MFGAILKATNSSFQKSMTFCRSIYVKKVMKLLAFIFEQPSYQGFSYECLQSNKLPHFSTKTYVLGTQKNRLNETVLLSTEL